MAEPIDFTARLAAKRAAQAGQDFLFCRCQERAEDPAGFAPVVLHDAGAPLLVALVCLACGEGLDVEAGRLVE